MEIHELLDLAKSKGASDLHLLASCQPLLRIDGALHLMEDTQELTAEDISQAFMQVTTPQQREIFSRDLELDFASTVPGGGPLRCNASQQQGTISLAFRLLSPVIPTVDDLGLPQLCKELIMKPRGLIVVTGPTGSGKSTTLAAMIQHLNETERRFLVTIEDPVEYIHPNLKCAVSQRQLAADTLSFASALRHVLRQDPDVILVGEMRDLETASAVLTIAETGHLILSTGHAPSSAQSVERIVDLFPPHERPMVQARLASLLVGVLCQALVPKKTGGRVAAVEIMLANAAIRNLIRDGKTYLLRNTIRTHGQLGMQTLDDALVGLYRRGIIDWDAVIAYCQEIDEVEKLAGGVQGKSVA